MKKNIQSTLFTILISVFFFTSVYAEEPSISLKLTLEREEELVDLPIYGFMEIKAAFNTDEKVVLQPHYSITYGNMDLLVRKKNEDTDFVKLHSGFFTDGYSQPLAPIGKDFHQIERRAFILDYGSPLLGIGGYEIKISISYLHNDKGCRIFSNTCNLNIVEPTGFEELAHEYWTKKVSKDDEKFKKYKKMVELFPTSRYTGYAYVKMSNHLRSTCMKGHQLENYDFKGIEESLKYALMAINSDMYIGSKDLALSIALDCYEVLGEWKNAEKMSNWLIHEYPHTYLGRKQIEKCASEKDNQSNNDEKNK
ncbi:MAG: hypothetical protein A2161_05690 [Candidatus Schekmanbacteria bacterium RBG_13_48_7]|uniref:Uncharacterized protein n=1 Tax=Candidatus Schekmanbacteria bacterium RBG_13_48_7 TaxID=1817878 RepID=A0A1F7RRS0_9BACT|nr:MAG: hypothetical protein A2161_05690 [Candidatus Schekmanbacteria bacterium RBG_13_48_7]